MSRRNGPHDGGGFLRETLRLSSPTLTIGLFYRSGQVLMTEMAQVDFDGDLARFADTAKALSHPARIRILQILWKSEHYVCNGAGVFLRQFIVYIRYTIVCPEQARWCDCGGQVPGNSNHERGDHARLCCIRSSE